MVKNIHHLYTLRVLAACMCMAVCWGVSTSPARGQSESHTFTLTRAPSAISLHIPVYGDREVVFKNEPDYAGRNICRGAIPLGANPRDFIGFAWDISSKKLYIDQNRNLDLTDDPEGLFEEDGGFGVYEDIRLTLGDEATVRPYLVNMSLYASGGDLDFADVEVKSGWFGDLALKGTKRLLTVVDDLDGQIDEKDLLLFGFPGSGKPRDESAVNSMRKIFFDNTLYDTAFAFEGGQSNSVLLCTLTTTKSKSNSTSGILHPNVTGFKRMMLAGPALVVLDAPEKSVRIPIGDYLVESILLDAGEPSGLLQASMLQDVLQVSTNKPAHLEAGIPLRNTLQVTRSGTLLSLSYSLLGKGHEIYGEVEENPANRPRFEVYLGDKKIHAGHFEYG